MAKTIFNNSPKTKTFRYKINGVPSSVRIKPFSCFEVKDLEDFSEILNRRDKEILTKMESGKIDFTNQSGYNLIRRTGFITPDSFEKVKYNRVLPKKTEEKEPIFSNLSELNQARFNSLPVGSFLDVSEEEYLNIKEATNSNFYGLDSDDLGLTGSKSLTAGVHVSFNDNVNPMGAIPMGEYIIGFAIKISSIQSISDPFELGINKSNVFPGSKGTFEYIPVGKPIKGLKASNTIVYLIRKNPDDILTEKTYFSIFCSGKMAAASLINLNSYKISSDNSTWSIGSNIPGIQAIATDSKSW